MKTAMQELLELCKHYQSTFQNPIGEIVKKIESELLEKEKEQMRLAHKNGYDNSQYRHDCNYGGVEYWDSVPRPFEGYYNETFNTK
jgi:hypothetical protein